MKKILQAEENYTQTAQPSDVLRKIADEVPLEDIGGNKIKKILKEMSEALLSQSDGVALAAPQIGYSLRIFVVSGKIFTRDFVKGRKERIEQKHGEDVSVPEAPAEDLTQKDLIFINPKISRLSRKKEWVPEGCLSVRPFYGKTFRSSKATITAFDENGNKFTRGASGLLAQIFQHETDHLNGILFIYHAKDVKEEAPK